MPQRCRGVDREGGKQAVQGEAGPPQGPVCGPTGPHAKDSQVTQKTVPLSVAAREQKEEQW